MNTQGCTDSPLSVPVSRSPHTRIIHHIWVHRHALVIHTFSDTAGASSPRTRFGFSHSTRILHAFCTHAARILHGGRRVGTRHLHSRIYVQSFSTACMGSYDLAVIGFSVCVGACCGCLLRAWCVRGNTGQLAAARAWLYNLSPPISVERAHRVQPPTFFFQGVALSLSTSPSRGQRPQRCAKWWQEDGRSKTGRSLEFNICRIK